MKQTFRHQNQEISYTVHRTHRKNSVALMVRPDAQVVLRLPQSFPLTQIQDFLQKRAPWILEKQKYFQQLKRQYPPKEFVSGESFPFLGKNLRLKIYKGQWEREGCFQEGRRLVLKVGENPSSAQIQSLILDWYGQQAIQYLKGRTEFFEGRLGVSPKKITVAAPKTKWGSCSLQGGIRFNWRLILMPRPIIDYVIVHELCHLIHKHHKKEFWNKVETILPNFMESKDWLKGHSFEYLNSI